MMIFTYDLPTSVPAFNQKMGYRLPTSILLPPYLTSNPYFTEYTDAVDTVFANLVHSRIEAFGNIRNMWVTTSAVEDVIYSYALVDFADWELPEHNLLVKQVNLLGMKLSNSSMVTDGAYLALSRFLGSYWFQKGKDSAIDFLNFCLGQNFTLVKMWTEDYQTFEEEGSTAIGDPVWAGGTWYPTTHVSIKTEGTLGMEPEVLTVFFHDIANYNLVLYSIDQVFDMKILPTYTSEVADIVALACEAENALVISNMDQYGADPPPRSEFSWVSTRFYSSDGPAVGYFLGQPSGWVRAVGGKKIPCYLPEYRVAEIANNLPTTCIGTGGILIGSSLVWVQIPGSPRSQALIPAYATAETLADVDNLIPEFVAFQTGSFSIVTGGTIVPPPLLPGGLPDFTVAVQFTDGMHPRTYVGVSPIPLTDPAGVLELYPDFFVPYWD